MNTVSRWMNRVFIPGEQNEYQPKALQEHALLGYAIALLLIKIAMIVGMTLYPVIAYSSEITQQRILDLANNAREEAGLSPLQMNTLLSRAASKKAQDMLDDQYFAHIKPDGTTPWIFIKNEQYIYRVAGENLGIDFFQAEALHDAWMASSTHRENILNTEFVDIGIGVAKGEFDGMDTVVAVQMFGTPLETPTINEPNALPTSSIVPEVMVTPQPTLVPSNAFVPLPSPIITPTIEERTSSEELVRPIIVQPYEKPYINSMENVIRGVASTDSTVSLLLNGEEIVHDVPVSSTGEFEIPVPVELIPDGHYDISVVLFHGTDMIVSDTVPISIDTTAPSVFPRAECTEAESGKLSVIAYSLIVHEAQTVQAYSDDVEISFQDKGNGAYRIELPQNISSRANITVEATDVAGNTTKEHLVYDPREVANDDSCSHVPRVLGLTYGELQSTTNCIVGFVGLYVFLVLILNVVVKVRVQRPRLVFNSLVFLSFIVVMLIV